jgi:hypothetical protein
LFSTNIINTSKSREISIILIGLTTGFVASSTSNYIQTKLMYSIKKEIIKDMSTSEINEVISDTNKTI